MVFHSVKNNFETTLTDTTTTNQTTIAITTSPNIQVPYWLTIGNNPTTGEIVEVIADNNGMLTVNRGQQGTTSQTFPAGTRVALLMTAGHLQEIQNTLSEEKEMCLIWMGVI